MPKPTTSQRKALKDLQKIDPKLEIRWDEKTGAPARVHGVLSSPQTGEAETIARQFLTTNKNLFALKTPEDELQLRAFNTDAVGNRHVRFQQMYKGLPVFGSELIVHMDRVNVIRVVNGLFVPRIDLPNIPKVSAKKAKTRILRHDPENRERIGETPMLLVFIHEGKPYLAWHMTVDGSDTALDGSKMPAKWEYFLDALTGRMIWRYNNLKTHDITTGTGIGRYAGNVTLNVVHNHTNNKYQLEDRTMPGPRIFTHNCAGNWPDPLCEISEDDDDDWSAPEQSAEVDCHFYTRVVFDYFLAMHGRNSYDNAGADMHICAHVRSNWNQAAWDGSQVLIGDGDGTTRNAFCTLDIIAHEWTHAVIDYMANLYGGYEPGAINESICDVFAALIDGNWLFAEPEDQWLKNTAPADRNLADPTNGGKYDHNDPLRSASDGHTPDHIALMYRDTGDNGGVHINCGILNKVAYLIAEGGTHYGVRVCEGLGRELLGYLYYHALSNYLSTYSDFVAMKEAVLDSLRDLYSGRTHYERWRISVTNAFASVGIGRAETCPPPCFIGPFWPPPRFPIGRCPPAPYERICPPQPLVAGPYLECPPAPAHGCLPGPDPEPFRPKAKLRKP